MVKTSEELSKLNAFFKISSSATAITYFLIFLGGLVRVSGAGLGCPDWPKCYGLWIPPTSLEQLPQGYDPSTFNATLTWIEYINRLFGVLTGFFILSVFYYSIRHFRANKNYLTYSTLSLIFVIFQGWLGKIVVDSELEPLIVTIHLVFAIVIVSLLLALSLQIWLEKKNGFKPNVENLKLEKYHPYSKILLIVIWIVSFMQLILGTQVREILEHIAEKYPLLEDVHKVDLVGNIGHIHGYLGILVFFLVVIFAYSIYYKSRNYPIIIKYLVAIFLSLIFIQVVVGISLVKVGIPQILQLFHQWTATLFLGILLVLYLLLKDKETIVAVE